MNIRFRKNPYWDVFYWQTPYKPKSSSIVEMINNYTRNIVTEQVDYIDIIDIKIEQVSDYFNITVVVAYILK